MLKLTRRQNYHDPQNRHVYQRQAPRNLIGSLEVSKVGAPAVINQIVVCSSGIPGGQSRLKEPLTLEGIARIEVLFSQRFKDNEPKKFYGM